MRFARPVILSAIWVVAATLTACQIRHLRLTPAGAPIAVSDVRESLGMGAYDSVVGTHRIIVSGHYNGPHGSGSFRRVYEPGGEFENHSQGAHVDEKLERFDGEVLWVETQGNSSYPMTQSHSRLACSVEWILSGRWLADSPSPFEMTGRTSSGPDSAPGFTLQLRDGGPNALVWLHPENYRPRSLEIEGRNGPLHIQFSDWRTRRGFAWAHTIRFDSESKTPTVLTTTEILFEPSAATIDADRTKRARMQGVQFAKAGDHVVRLHRSASGHMLVRPTLQGKDVGWFLVDTGTGVNCLDPETLLVLDEFVSNGPLDGRPISVVGLGGTVQTRVRKGGDFALGSMQAKNMEWVALDLSGLQDVVGVPLAGVLGSEFFERAVVEIDLLESSLKLHDPRGFDAGQLPWRPLRFDGTTPCVQARFAPDHEGWFRLDTGSDDTVTFHSPWVRKLRMVDKASQLVPIRLKGIGGEIRAVRGRIRWFELMGQRFPKPKVTMVERATGPLANPDLYGNIGVGFFKGQRLILDYPSHRVALIPR